MRFLAIDANAQDSLAEMGHFARTYQLTIPFLKDAGNVVADGFSAERTPEVFVLDRERTVRYRGRIDDQYGFQSGVGYQRPKAVKRDLAEAIDELLAAKSVTNAVTRAPGCLIGRVGKAKADAEVTFSKHIAPLFNQHCVRCHREGEIAPFSLSNYDEVAGWAPMIDEVVHENRMPPWHADPKVGHFANDSRLGDEDKQLIADWVAAGAPQGDPRDLPPAPQFTEGWQISKPDRIIGMADQPYTVPAEGKIEYQYFTVDPGFTKDVWVQQAEAGRATTRWCTTSSCSSSRPASRCRRWAKAPIATCSSALLPAIRPRGCPAAWPSEFRPARSCCSRCTTRPTAPNRRT